MGLRNIPDGKDKVSPPQPARGSFYAYSRLYVTDGETITQRGQAGNELSYQFGAVVGSFPFFRTNQRRVPSIM